MHFPLHLLKRAAIRSAYNDKKEAEYIASEYATAMTGITATFGYPKFSEDHDEKDPSRSKRVD